MSFSPTFPYNIIKPSNEFDQNPIYKTYNQDYNRETQNNDIIYQSQNIEKNPFNSILNQSSPIPFNSRNSYNENNNMNININNDNDDRFSRLNSRLDEINTKIDMEKIDKETFIQNKIASTELMLKINNENCLRKIKEAKNSIKDLYNFLDQIKLFSKKTNEETDKVLDSIEMKFNARIKEEQNQRINLEKKLKNLIETKFKDMKYKISEKSQEKSEDQEDVRNKIEEKLPQLKSDMDEEKKIRISKDEEIREKIKDKMNYYNNIMRKEIKNRENFDEQTLDDIKSSFGEFNKQLRQTSFNREQSEGKLIDLVEATISQFEANGNIIINNV